MSRITNQPTEKMSDKSFRMMSLFFKIVDFFFPYIKKRLKKFGIKDGMIVVDYGCGPGRYTLPIAEMVGIKGKVYAVDIHEMALKKVQEKIRKSGIKNIETSLAKENNDGEYNSGLPDNIADIVCAIDMFFIIKRPQEFLSEIQRILKPDGILIIDDGHQSRKETKQKIDRSGIFSIIEETKDHLKYKIAQK
ncbi:MAG: class I SAM-dependent methyltransferase [Atribacterota bacterium]